MVLHTCLDEERSSDNGPRTQHIPSQPRAWSLYGLNHCVHRGRTVAVDLIHVPASRDAHHVLSPDVVFLCLLDGIMAVLDDRGGGDASGSK